MTVDGLGATGQKIYDFIRDTQAATGLVPSYDPEATIKRLSVGEDRVRLLPANPAYQPIEADDVQILGRVVTVLRRI